MTGRKRRTIRDYALWIALALALLVALAWLAPGTSRAAPRMMIPHRTPERSVDFIWRVLDDAELQECGEK
jgi:hypothetical protein